MKKEIWKSIPNYYGLYEISNFGNIKRNKKRLKPCVNKHGYYVVNLCNKNQKTFAIHQLMAITFLNHIPDQYKIVVDHIDNDKTNNRLDNLQLITQRENTSKDRKTKSEFVGVTKRKNKYIARIRIGKERKHIGTFDDLKTASDEYLKALKSI